MQNEAAKQKNDLLKEFEGLRMELQHVREDRENKSAQVDSLMADLGTYKEMTGKTAVELHSAMTRTSALEVWLCPDAFGSYPYRHIFLTFS